MKIGFYDSGLGGLTILKAVRDAMPQYDYVYLGDTANLPFGDKSEEEIYKHTEKGVRALFEKGALLVIIACNTASAESLRKIQDGFLHNEYPSRKVLGVIIPTIETLLVAKSKKALLIGTNRTIDSKKYFIELEKINAKTNLHAIATPALVPLIEAHDFDSAFLELQNALHEVVGEVDTLILGCTHYTMLKELIREVYPEIQVISQDEIIPEKIKNYLDRHAEIDNLLSRTGSIEVLLTKESTHYDKIKNSFFNV